MNSASMARRMVERGLDPAMANAIAEAVGEEAERSLVTGDRLEAELRGLELRLIGRINEIERRIDDKFTGQTRFLVGLILVVAVAVIGLYFR
jgi:hypothetical protein